jgi:bifunctional ADP-heptose synthase (sugar kinase/adenylyltransferase)
MNSREKIVSLEVLRGRAAEARASGCRIILVAGRFDLIGPEVIAVLHSARTSPALVVAVVAPDSANPSLLAAHARAQLAAALASVDFVVIGAAAAIRGAVHPDQSLDISADLASKLIERFRMEHRE